MTDQDGQQDATVPAAAPPAAPPPPPVPGPAAAQPEPPAPGWDAVAPARRSRRGWLIGCGALLLLLIVAMGACGALLVKTVGPAGAVLAASNGQIDGFNAQSINGRNEITFQAAVGVDGEDGVRLACEVIGPALAGSDLERTPWVIVNRAGDVIGSSETACP